MPAAFSFCRREWLHRLPFNKASLFDEWLITVRSSCCCVSSRDFDHDRPRVTTNSFQLLDTIVFVIAFTSLWFVCLSTACVRFEHDSKAGLCPWLALVARSRLLLGLGFTWPGGGIGFFAATRRILIGWQTPRDHAKSVVTQAPSSFRIHNLTPNIDFL